MNFSEFSRQILLKNHVRVYYLSCEYEILIMILVQLGVYLITCLPFPIYLVYLMITIKWVKSNVQLALNTSLSTIVYALTNINFGATFYIYILTTRVFREDLKRILVENRLFKSCFCSEQDSRTIRNMAIVINQQTILKT